MLHYAQMLTCDGAEACPKYFVRVAAMRATERLEG